MKGAIKKVTALIMAGCVLLLSGCQGETVLSNYREIENLELVRVIGVDKAEGGVNVVTCALPVSGGDSGSSSKPGPRIFEKQAETMSLALSYLEKMPLGKEAILSHVEHLLIDEERAREGISGCLDYVERFVEIRLDTNLFIVKGMTTKELFTGLSGKNTFPADILTAFENDAAKMGKGYVFTCRDTAISLAKSNVALVMAVTGVKEEKLFEDRGDMNLAPAGFAVIKDGKLEDFLNDEETLGALFLISKFKADTVNVESDGSTVTLLLDGVKTDITPEFDENGKLKKVSVKLDVQANVVNVTGEGKIEDEAFREKLQEELSKLVKKSAEASIDRSQSMDMDFLGLGGQVELKEPVKYAKMKESFEELFSDLDISVEAESILRRTYDLQNPVTDAGEEDPDPWEKMIKSLKDS